MLRFASLKKLFFPFQIGQSSSGDALRAHCAQFVRPRRANDLSGQDRKEGQEERRGHGLRQGHPGKVQTQAGPTPAKGHQGQENKSILLHSIQGKFGPN